MRRIGLADFRHGTAHCHALAPRTVTADCRGLKAIGQWASGEATFWAFSQLGGTPFQSSESTLGLTLISQKPKLTRLGTPPAFCMQGGRYKCEAVTSLASSSCVLGFVPSVKQADIWTAGMPLLPTQPRTQLSWWKFRARILHSFDMFMFQMEAGCQHTCM